MTRALACSRAHRQCWRPRASERWTLEPALLLGLLRLAKQDVTEGWGRLPSPVLRSLVGRDSLAARRPYSDLVSVLKAPPGVGVGPEAPRDR